MSFIQTVKFLIENSPFGFITHIDQLLRKIDLSLILENEAEYMKLIKQAEENEFRQIPFEDSYVLMTPYNKIGDNYLCQTKSEHIKYQLSPLNENLSNLEKVEINSPIRDKFLKAMEEYMNKYFPALSLPIIINDIKKAKPNTVGGPTMPIAKQETIVSGQDKENTSFYINFKDLGSNKFEVYIIISSHHLNYSNNQTAKWISYYKICSGNNPGECNVSGLVKIGNYFFDTGNNSHFNLEEELKEKVVKAENDEKIATEALKAIEDFENCIQEKLFDLFGNFNNEVMKYLRRNVAVSGGKMNWNINRPSFSTLKDD